MRQPLETTAAIYDAFAKGDMATILGALAHDVQWEAWSDNTAQQRGVPWLRGGQGHAAVLEFFQMAGNWRIHEFRVLALMANETQVAVEVVMDAEVPSTGRRFRDEELHLWTFNDEGLVIRMRHYTDTAKHIATAGLE